MFFFSRLHILKLSTAVGSNIFLSLDKTNQRFVSKHISFRFSTRFKTINIISTYQLFSPHNLIIQDSKHCAAVPVLWGLLRFHHQLLPHEQHLKIYTTKLLTKLYTYSRVGILLTCKKHLHVLISRFVKSEFFFSQQSDFKDAVIYI